MQEFEFGEVYGWGRRPSLHARRAAVAPTHRPAGTATDVTRTFVAALGAQEFTRLRDCLAAHVRMRALRPDGVCECEGPDAVVEQFQDWFSGHAELDLLDSTVERVGRRPGTRWLLRLRMATHSAHHYLIDQHAHVNAIDRIQRLDLLCSGYHEEAPP